MALRSLGTGRENGEDSTHRIGGTSSSTGNIVQGDGHSRIRIHSEVTDLTMYADSGQQTGRPH